MSRQKKEGKIKILKIGRKWIQVAFLAETYQKKAKLLLDGSTKIFKEGDIIEGEFFIEYKENYYMKRTEWELEYIDEQKKTQNEINHQRHQLNRFIQYIENNMNLYKKPYWYQKGEDTVLQAIAYLEKYDNQCNIIQEQKNKLNQLRDQYEEKINQYYQEQKLKEQQKKGGSKKHLNEDIIYLHNFEEPYQIGEIVEHKGVLYKVVEIDQRIEPDSLSFGGYGDNLLMYSCRADQSTVTEIERQKWEKSNQRGQHIHDIKEKMRQIKEHINTLLRQCIDQTGKNFIDENADLSILKDAKILKNTFNAYGGGEQVLIKDNILYHMKNNSMDGDDWNRSNIIYDGTGVIGRYTIIDLKIQSILDEIDQKNKELSKYQDQLKQIEKTYYVNN